MDSTNSGYREIEHTADWMIEVWGTDLSALLEQAARGMYALSGVHLENENQRSIVLELDFHDPESLLVRFLGELLYLIDQNTVGVDEYQIQVKGSHLSARLIGSPISRLDKEIKAVTYHNLEVKTTERGVEARIVFDV